MEYRHWIDGKEVISKFPVLQIAVPPPPLINPYKPTKYPISELRFETERSVSYERRAEPHMAWERF